MVRLLHAVGDRAALAVATTFGMGFFPLWPGTVGSAMGIAPVLALAHVDPALKATVYVCLFILCVWAAQRTEEQLGVADHRSIVCDETWAMAVVWECTSSGVGWMFAAFLVFRLLDALKPGPIGKLERSVSGGLGIMLDDALAALTTVVMMQALQGLTGASVW
jgi:phosphatidylglycerophosphatase A